MPTNNKQIPASGQSFSDHKKKRGRPPKNKNAPPVNNESSRPEQNRVQSSEQPTKRRPGRPRKDGAENSPKKPEIIIRDAPTGTRSGSGSSGFNPLNTDPKQILARRIGFRSGDVTDTDFEEQEINFAEIMLAYDTDSYVRAGIDKYIDLMWKEGYVITGRNQDAVKYVKDRFAYMGETTQVPIDQFFYDITEDLIKYHNVMILKARMNNPLQLPPGYSIVGRAGLQPIVGYFTAPAATFQARRDQFGTVKQWKQSSRDESAEKTFRPEDVIHIYYRKEKDELWGKPFLVPVLEDVLSLREAEESVLRLIWRNIFPYYHVKVGTDEYPANEQDVTRVENTIQRMDREGGVVTTHNIEIKSVAADQVINGEPYLRYWEQRIFTGIGLPELYFGRGDTANRATADNMMGTVSDKITAYQRVQQIFIFDKIIKELLIEGGYDPILNDDDKVFFIFKNTDLDRQQKLENQAIMKYEKHAITEDEMREEIGRDPIELEDQDKRDKMYVEVVQRRLAEIKAEYAETKQPDRAAGNRAQPANQHGKNPSAKRRTNSVSPDGVEAGGGANQIDEILPLVVEELYSAKESVLNISRKLWPDSNFALRPYDPQKYLLIYYGEITDVLYIVKEKIFDLNAISNICPEQKNIFISCLFDELFRTIQYSASVYNNKIDFINDVSVAFDLFIDNIKIEYYNLTKGAPEING